MLSIAISEVPASEMSLGTGRAVTATGTARVEPPGPTTEPRDETEDQSVVKNSAVMAIGSLISRVTGLLRTVAVGAAIGAAKVADDYNISNALPNMVYELLLGGVLASVLVPVLVRARKRDADRGQAYAQRLVTLAAVFLAAATVLAVLAAPLLATVFVGHHTGPDHSLVTRLNYLILPEIFFYGMAALLAAILNTRGHFAAPTFTPILNNVVVIVTAVAFAVLPFTGSTPRPDNITATQVLVLGIGTTMGIVIQMVGLMPALRKVGYRWRWRFDWGKLHLRELGRSSVWMLFYVATSQIALVVLTIVSKRAGSANNPGPAIFNNAFLIFMMAHGIVAVSIMTALMPRLASAAAEGRFEDLATQFSMGTRLSAVVLIPATAAYVVLGQPLAVTLFQFGNYSHDEALHTGTVIAIAAIGLVPFAISQMQLFAFYAMPDTRTPALLNVPVVAVRILGYVVFYNVLSRGPGGRRPDDGEHHLVRTRHGARVHPAAPPDRPARVVRDRTGAGQATQRGDSGGGPDLVPGDHLPAHDRYRKDRVGTHPGGRRAAADRRVRGRLLAAPGPGRHRRGGHGARALRPVTPAGQSQHIGEHARGRRLPLPEGDWTAAVYQLRIERVTGPPPR